MRERKTYDGIGLAIGFAAALAVMALMAFGGQVGLTIAAVLIAAAFVLVVRA